MRLAYTVAGSGAPAVLITGRQLTNFLRDGRFELVEGARHSPMWERPERFTALVRQFGRGRGRIRNAAATAIVAT